MKNWATGSQLVRDGYVRCVQFHSGADGTAYLKGTVIPRMRPGCYKAFVLLSVDDGKVDRIIGGLCECKAGLSQSCFHVAGLLIMSSYLTDASVTSLPCKWIDPGSGAKSGIAIAKDLPFGRVPFATAWRGRTADPSDLERAIKAEELELSWTAYRQIDRDNTADQAQPCPYPELPDPFTYLKSLADRMGIEKLTVKDLVSSLSLSQQREFLQKATANQASIVHWHSARSLRITSSNSGLICRRRTGPVPPSVLSTVLEERDLSRVRAIQYGRETEEEAVREYLKRMLSSSFSKCGFFVHADEPYLGASPDGLVTVEDCETGCLEIKCTFAHQYHTIPEACEESAFFLEKTSAGIQLKRNHPYYYQVMGQLGVTGLKWSHFVVFTKKDMHIEKIIFDEKLPQEMCVKLRCYYYDVVGPHLLQNLTGE